MNREELKKRLLDEGFPADSFSVDGAWLEDAIILRSVGAEFHLKYIEKGRATELGRFSTEEDACEAMYRKVHDSWPGELPGRRPNRA